MIVSSIVPLQRSEKDEELNVCHLGMLGLEHHGLLLELNLPKKEILLLLRCLVCGQVRFQPSIAQGGCMPISIDQIDDRDFRQVLLSRARRGDNEALAVLRDEYGVILHLGDVLNERKASDLAGQSEHRP